MLSSSGSRLCCPCSWLRKLWQRDHNSMIRFVLGRNLFVIVFGLLNGSIGEYSGVPSPQMILVLLKSHTYNSQFFGYAAINPLFSSPYLPEFMGKKFNVLCRGSCSTKTGLINSTEMKSFSIQGLYLCCIRSSCTFHLWKALSLLS